MTWIRKPKKKEESFILSRLFVLICVMDTTRGEAKGCENHKAMKSNEVEDQACEEESESQCLLPPPPPPRKGGMSRSSEKIKRSVQWNDNKGDNLAEVLVYEPSEVSDSDEDDCICTIM